MVAVSACGACGLRMFLPTSAPVHVPHRSKQSFAVTVPVTATSQTCALNCLESVVMGSFTVSACCTLVSLPEASLRCHDCWCSARVVFVCTHTHVCCAKIRLQFLGIPVAALTVSSDAVPNAPPFSLVPEALELNDCWVRPLAVRAASCHSTSRDLSKIFVTIDPDKFAVHPTMQLVDAIKGAFHCADYRNLRSIVENGILPRTNVDESSSGRLHSHFSVYAPWDKCSRITKYRVQGSKSRLWRCCTSLPQSFFG